MPKMNVNAFFQKDYENEPPSGSKKQTQTNPILSAVGGFPKAKMNIKSLAKKSAHTRRSPTGAIILTFVSDMNILKRFLQGEVE